MTDNVREAVVLDVTSDHDLANSFLKQKQEESSSLFGANYTLEMIYFDFKENLVNVVSERGNQVLINVTNNQMLSLKDKETIAMIRVAAQDLGYIVGPLELNTSTPTKVTIPLYEDYTSSTHTAEIIDLFNQSCDENHDAAE